MPAAKVVEKDAWVGYKGAAGFDLRSESTSSGPTRL